MKKFWICTNIPLFLRGHSAVLPGAGNVYSPGVNESRQKQWRNRLRKPGGFPCTIVASVQLQNPFS